jgi:hypothetical protein
MFTSKMSDRFPSTTYYTICDRTSLISMVAIQTQTVLQLSDRHNQLHQE